MWQFGNSAIWQFGNVSIRQCVNGTRMKRMEWMDADFIYGFALHKWMNTDTFGSSCSDGCHFMLKIYFNRKGRQGGTKNAKTLRFCFLPLRD